MKYIKTFETKVTLILPRYKGKIIINTPSTNYFKSSIALQVIFVDSVKTVYETERLPSEQPNVFYQIEADDTIQCNVGGSINYTDWNQDYVEWEFDKIKFMTTEEFYENYTELFLNILEKTIAENLSKKTDFYKDKIKGIIKKLTIPETEHIVDAEKYNL